MTESKKIRIQKILSDFGICSRRKAENLIVKGCVKVNDDIAKLGDKADINKDIIKINNNIIKLDNIKNKKYYIMLHKPRGFLSSVSDDRGRKCVTDLLKGIDANLYPIGRLDKDSEGLLLMTNDGDFANELMHPSKHVEKKYRVTVKPKITEEKLVQLSVGIEIEGKKTLPAKVELIKSLPDRSVLEITLMEGKNRQIRRMCENVGLRVARLKRVSIGKVKLGMLKAGSWRELTKEEENLLKGKI